MLPFGAPGPRARVSSRGVTSLQNLLQKQIVAFNSLGLSRVKRFNGGSHPTIHATYIPPQLTPAFFAFLPEDETGPTLSSGWPCFERRQTRRFRPARLPQS